MKKVILFALLFLPLLAFSQSSNYDKGYALFQKKDYKGALEYFSKAIAENPNNTEAYNFIGIVKGELGGSAGINRGI